MSLHFVDIFQMCFKIVFSLEDLRANVALEGFYVTRTVNGSLVTKKCVLLGKFPAANLALVSGVRMLRSGAAALSMRRVVVSADR